MSKISFYQDRKGVEVRVFELSSEIEDRDEVEVATGRSTKRPFTLNDCILFYLQADYKKKSDINSFIFFCCVLTVK
jgi:hypothetical protein